MASLTKHPKSQYWTACYTNREGRQVKRSTKSTDRNQAYEIAIELERVERRAMQGTLTNTQIKKVLSDVSEKVTGDTLIAPTREVDLIDLHFLSAFGTRGVLCPKLAVKVSGGRRGLSEGFKRIVTNAGLDLMTVQGKGLKKFSKHTFHSLRHSFNSAMAYAGVSDEVRMKFTGHSSKEMNHHYTHLQEDTLRNAMSLLPLFGITLETGEKGK